MELADATDSIKFQMMQNRLYLSNYLLSGDTREVDRMNEGDAHVERETANRASPHRLRAAEKRSRKGAAK